jgi:hypothetical protein
MQNPDLLVDALVDRLRGMPEVLDLVHGDPDLIEVYGDDADSAFAAVYEGGANRILAVLTAVESDERSRWVYTVTLYLRVAGHRLGGAFVAICGTPVPGAGTTFANADPHPDFVWAAAPTFERQLDEDGIEYPVIVMRFTDATAG